MSDSQSSSGTYGAFVVVVLIAIAAVAMLRFDMFGVQTLLSGEPESLPPVEQIVSTPSQPGEPEAEPKFPPNPPETHSGKPRNLDLPERTVVLARAGARTIEIPMILVPGNWLAMGENDGVRSNMPKRWIWVDDFYLAETETTNDQYYSFVLGRGYDTPQFWSPHGFSYMQSYSIRGSEHIGWRSIETREDRVWALASPSYELTFEIWDRERQPVGSGVNVLLLDGSDDVASWLTVDAVTRSVRMKILDSWRDVSGEDVALERRVRQNNLLHRTDSEGRVTLPNPGNYFNLTVVAWADGSFMPPLVGHVQRGATSWMRAANMPVVGVSWFEADAACRFFGGSLPTEAQWERAARGDDDRPFPWGQDSGWGERVTVDGVTWTTTPYANINRRRIMPVKQFPQGRGPFGHYDLLGNVSEWCADVYLLSPRWAPSNPRTIGQADNPRSERGVNTTDDEPTPAYHRRSADPHSRGAAQARGFRLAMTPEEALARQ